MNMFQTGSKRETATLVMALAAAHFGLMKP